MIKSIYQDSTVNILINDEKLEAFSLRSGIKQGCSLLLPLSYTLLVVLANTIRQEKEIERDADWEGRNKTAFVCR